MNFDTQANGMIILHRFNLFKRLESSVYSFEETLRRLLEKIERTEQQLQNGSGNISEEDTDFSDLDSEDLYIEGKYEIDVRHLRVDDYLEDLFSDKHIISEIYKDARSILDGERDQKLKDLTDILERKIKETPYNTGNRKVIIFTAFADTADYLYSRLSEKMERY